MDKILAIARYEYGRHVRTRGFLATALGIPLLVVVIVGIVAIVATRSEVEERLGLVDPSGRFAAVDVLFLWHFALGLHKVLCQCQKLFQKVD